MPSAQKSNKGAVIAASTGAAVAALAAIAFIILFCKRHQQRRASYGVHGDNSEPKGHAYDAQRTFPQPSFPEALYHGLPTHSPSPSPSPSPMAAAHRIQPSAETLLLLQRDTGSARQEYLSWKTQCEGNDRNTLQVRNGMDTMAAINDMSAPPAYEMLPQTPPPAFEKPVTLQYPDLECPGRATNSTLAVPSGSAASGDARVRRAKSVA